jgi:hypothetical protein
LKRAVDKVPEDLPDIEIVARVEAEHLRFREAPRTVIRFSGTPDYESSRVSRRRNLPDPVSQHVDYHNVQVDYRLTNRLRNGDPAQKRQTAGSDISPPL